MQRITIACARVPDTLRVGKGVIASISVDMQHTAPGVAAQELQGGLRTTASGVVEDDDRRVAAAMASLVPGNGPEAIASRLAGPRCDDRYCRVVHEQTVACLQRLRHPVDNRTGDPHGATGPVPEHGPVEIDPLSPVCLALAKRCCAADYEAEALFPHGEGRFSSILRSMIF